LTPTDPNQDETNEMIGLTGRKIRDLMYLLVLIVFNKILIKHLGNSKPSSPAKIVCFSSERQAIFVVISILLFGLFFQ